MSQVIEKAISLLKNPAGGGDTETRLKKWLGDEIELPDDEIKSCIKSSMIFNLIICEKKFIKSGIYNSKL